MDKKYERILNKEKLVQNIHSVGNRGKKATVRLLARNFKTTYDEIINLCKKHDDIRIWKLDTSQGKIRILPKGQRIVEII
jgi:hypothetical protein